LQITSKLRCMWAYLMSAADHTSVKRCRRSTVPLLSAGPAAVQWMGTERGMRICKANSAASVAVANGDGEIESPLHSGTDVNYITTALGRPAG